MRRRRSRDGSAGYISRYALGRDYHKLLRARLQKLCDRIQRRGRTLRSPRIHRQRAGAGKGPGAQRRTGLDRQAYEFDRPQRRLVFFSRRDLSRSRTAGRRAEHGALRLVQRLHARLSHRRHRRALPARCTALHFLPDHRARRDAFPWSFAARSATASTVATTASWSVLGTSSRGPQPRRILRCGMDWTTRSCIDLFAWSEADLRKGPAAAPSGASAMNAGCAMSRLRWAMRPPHPP